MQLVIGKTYFGPDDAAYSLMRIDGDRLTLLGRKGTERVVTRAAFAEWAAGSERRTRIRAADGEMRVKIETSAAVVSDDGVEILPALVRYVTRTEPTREQCATLPEWAAWTAEAV